MKDLFSSIAEELRWCRECCQDARRRVCRVSDSVPRRTARTADAGFTELTALEPYARGRSQVSTNESVAENQVQLILTGLPEFAPDRTITFR